MAPTLFLPSTDVCNYFTSLVNAIFNIFRLSDFKLKGLCV